MIVATNLPVRCLNSSCPAPADTSVPIAEAAPGVLALPRLLCAGCRHEVHNVTEEGAPDA
ncbi:hypothetical protein [Kineosporia succinea]|uniref:Uncharacterized protein n=1 Tax=Kineosporia succinea TaxID=84632 RepID=A0ABT9P5T1_9ACTN|nr:hypothetical protein [Kineosporia succinea]MDP9828051.1 hypothetical protein [Kineosporia succinea]